MNTRVHVGLFHLNTVSTPERQLKNIFLSGYFDDLYRLDLMYKYICIHVQVVQFKRTCLSIMGKTVMD
jgi:hypothetical protein